MAPRLEEDRGPACESEERQASKYSVSVSGALYARARARCLELGITIGDLVDSLLDQAVPMTPPRPGSIGGSPRVAIDVSEQMFQCIDQARAEAREYDGEELSRSQVLESAIVQALDVFAR